MAKPNTRSRKSDSFSKGKVTPVQVAFIVDRYLSDNKYTDTRSSFRSEASTLIAKSTVREAPKSLLSLGEMLDEYICLKEQKVIFDQEKSRLEQEKLKVQRLLHGMQTAMDAYNVDGNTLPVSMASADRSAVNFPQWDPRFISPPGQFAHTTPTLTPPSMSLNSTMNHASYSTPPTSNQTTRKRKLSNVAPNAPLVAKKTRSRLPTKKLPIKAATVEATVTDEVKNKEKVQQLSLTQLLTQDCCVDKLSPVHGSSIVKNLFNQSSESPQTNSPGLKTPPHSRSRQSDKSISPVENISAANSSTRTTPQANTPSKCTIITSRTVIVSPYKPNTYSYVERNHCPSTSSPLETNSKQPGKRDHVKGRLDFDCSDVPVSSESPVADCSSTPESEDGDYFDLDLPQLDFSSFSELLGDFDIDCGGNGTDFTSHSALSSSMTTISGTTQLSENHGLGSNQIMSEYSSTVTNVFTDKDPKLQGLDSLTSVQSITKSIKFSSPAKNHRSSPQDQ